MGYNLPVVLGTSSIGSQYSFTNEIFCRVIIIKENKLDSVISLNDVAIILVTFVILIKSDDLGDKFYT